MPGGIEYACQGRFMIPKIILTSPLAAGVRTLTRHAGLNRLVSQLMRNRGYEERFGSELDRKSTRLNSSHGYISYAVFCLKKKKTTHNKIQTHANISSRSHKKIQ